MTPSAPPASPGAPNLRQRRLSRPQPPPRGGRQALEMREILRALEATPAGMTIGAPVSVMPSTAFLFRLMNLARTTEASIPDGAIHDLSLACLIGQRRLGFATHTGHLWETIGAAISSMALPPKTGALRSGACCRHRCAISASEPSAVLQPERQSRPYPIPSEVLPRRRMPGCTSRQRCSSAAA